MTFAADPGRDHHRTGAAGVGVRVRSRKGAEIRDRVRRLVMFIIRRGDRYGVRLLDPQGSARANFKGLRYFPLQTAYRVDAKFVPYDTPKKVPVPNVLGHVGADGEPGLRRLHAAGPRAVVSSRCTRPSKHEDLFFIFKDLTSRTRDLPGRPLPPHAATEERPGRSRLQPRLQPAVRVHRVRDLPAADESESTAGAHRGGRAEISESLVPRLSSFAKVLTLPSTGSCGDGSVEDGGRGATAEPIPAVRPLIVVELQKAIERRLQRSAGR